MSAATAKARPAVRPELRRDEVHELRLVQGTRPRRSLMAVVALLVAQSWTMRAELDRKASPTELEKAAKANGMVPAGKSGFITLETGTVEAGTPAK